VHDSAGIASIFGETVRQMRLCLGLHSDVKRSRPFSCSPNSQYAGTVCWLLKFLVVRRCAMALGITSIFGEKRPILCVTEKKTP